jgi:hypothetical protein
VATNFYFQPFPQEQVTNEQLLVEDLVIEAMGIYGMDVYYLPRSSRGTEDMLYGEDTMKQYRTAHNIEMYLENITGMEGEQDFISKFGLEVRDEITLLVSRRRFKYTVGATNFQTPILGDITPEENRAPTRPREGDLVYLPLLKNFFEITFVEHENDQAMFYTLGRGRGGNVYVYSLKLKQYVFSEEIINTGVAEVDEQVFDAYERTRLTVQLTGGSGTFEPGEIIYQGTNSANANVQAIVHTWRTGQYVDVIRTQGTFAANVLVKGATSNSSWVLASSNDKVTLDNAFEDIADNNRIETESDSILDWTETNPFGAD